jgi:hypothetical protein
MTAVIIPFDMIYEREKLEEWPARGDLNPRPEGSQDSYPKSLF